MLDASQKWADLSYASGEAGKVLKENKHRLNLSGKSNVAKSIREKTTQLIVDISQIRSENPLLPYTKSQLTLPLLSGETVLGALDVHSTKEDAFTAQDIDAYQNMANSIAIAIENSRLFEEAQQNLAEMRATQRQYLQNAWDTLSTETPLQYELGERSISKNNELELPLTLRDQVIGKIQMGNSAEWTSEQKNLVESIIAQTSLALENARLVEESQSTAIQERLTNEIIAKIWASTSMDSILQTAVRELGRGLEVNEVEIEVSMDKYQDDK
ncbi:MAG: putative signaling protein [Chloroflexi bacterium OLB14]|nr:MAG: putative signaling protein [Chloroflexi bacterium OLB14]